MRNTRWGTVAQRMHPVRPTRTKREIAVNDQFAGAQTSWSLMPIPMRAKYSQLLRTRGAGLPGPWIGQILTYLDTGMYYPLIATNPDFRVRILDVECDGPHWTVTLDQPPPSPYHYLWFFAFSVPPEKFAPSFWRRLTWETDVVEFTLGPPVRHLHLIAVPVGTDIFPRLGLGDILEVPYP